MSLFNKILTGSSVFFQSYSDFNPKDVDYIILVENPKHFKNMLQLRSNVKNEDIFIWRKMPVDEFIQVTLDQNLPMSICKFLTPEFNEKIGFSIEDLPKLQTLVDKLDKRHEYLKIIYEAYMENNKFVLTDMQREIAYNNYKTNRNDN